MIDWLGRIGLAGIGIVVLLIALPIAIYLFILGIGTVGSASDKIKKATAPREDYPPTIAGKLWYRRGIIGKLVVIYLGCGAINTLIYLVTGTWIVG